MSEARIRILADVKGLDNIDKLKGAFRGLEQAIGPTDQSINRAREQIINFGNAGRQTEQVIRGQISALEGLRAQATVGGETYRRLTGDLARLAENFSTVTTEMRGARSAAQEFSNAMTGIIGSSANVVGKQISTLKTRIGEMKYGANELITTLQRIKELETVSSARTGRNQVTAAANAYASPVLNTGFGSEARLPGMPDTSAALSQRIGELTDKLANVTRGGQDYMRVAQEISAIQRELARDFVAEAETIQAATRAEDQRAARLAVNERIWQQRNVNSGFAGFSSRASAITEAGNRQVSLPGYQVSDLYQSINNVGMGRINAQIEMMGKSYEKVATDIRAATSASNGSINSLQAQRTAWASLSQAVEKGSAEYRDAQREIKAVDKQLESGQGGGLQRFGRTAGAVAASGVFGGPEGLIGAGIGAFLGPEGALAGGAIGAQVGQLRQSIGDTAEYSANLERLKIALQGVTGSAKEYAAAQGSINGISRQLNQPILDATQGFTQLAAAVKGAGGKVVDAEIVYRGVSQAIKATGGSSEDAKAALLAMSQVFSKSKVSAEELQGQLGERLPGAVTLFAKATGRTLPQLSKDLQAGTVGLNDLIKFTQALSTRYSADAEKIAKSSQDAGARMTIAWDELRNASGKLFQPLGAWIQDVTTKLISMTTAAVKAAGAIGQAFNARSQAFSDANKKFGLNGSITDIGTELSPAYWNFVNARYNQIQSANAAKEAAAKPSGTPTNFGATKGNADTSPALRDQLALALAQEQAAKNTYKTNVELARTDQLRVAYSTKIVEYNKIERDFAEGKLRIKEKELSILKVESDYRTRVNAINHQAQEENARIAKKAQEDAQKLEKDQLQAMAEQADAYVKLHQSTLDIASFGKTDIDAADMRLKEAKELNRLEIEAFNLKAKARMADARKNGIEDETANLLRVERELLLDQQKIRARNIELQGIELIKAKELNRLENNKQIAAEKYQGKAAVSGLQIGLAKSMGLPTALLERSRLADQQAQRRQELSDMAQGIAIRENARQELMDKGENKYRQQIVDLDIQIKQLDQILELKRQQAPIMDDLELKQQKLNEFAERYGGIFDAISQGLTKTFDLLVTGTDNWGNSLRTIASTVLQDIARQLLKVLVIDQAISAFRNIFSPVKSTGAAASLFNPATAANGKVFASNGIVPFAMGGIIDKPTIFPFAKGIGLMGEAGPEAIMPLRRGRDGRLGVAGGGGGDTTINVSVDAKGTNVQGDSGQGAALARAVSQAVQTEMVKQRRPGGILAS